MHADGRMLRDPIIRWYATDNGLQFAVDDGANPEFWFMLLVTLPELEKMLAAARSKQPTAEQIAIDQ